MKIKDSRIEKLDKEEREARRLSILVKYLCLSACCKYHYTMNGNLFEFEQVRQIYASNDIHEDCNCALSQVLVNDLGEPLFTKAIERVRAQKHRF